MSLTREDMLRELELLPVWKQRASKPQAEVDQITEKHVSETQSQPKSIAMLRILVSEDSNYLFLLAQLQTAEEETLLQNMLKSIAAKIRVDTVSASMSQMLEYSPKVILVMGEKAVQNLLNLTETLGELRGKPYSHNNIPVIVTYHQSHLLMNGADKAKAWEDLCLAKTTMQNL